eukprot:248301-Chlamydomonas_euryale.AAC.1
MYGMDMWCVHGVWTRGMDAGKAVVVCVATPALLLLLPPPPPQCEVASQLPSMTAAAAPTSALESWNRLNNDPLLMVRIRPHHLPHLLMVHIRPYHLPHLLM